MAVATLSISISVRNLPLGGSHLVPLLRQLNLYRMFRLSASKAAMVLQTRLASSRKTTWKGIVRNEGGYLH
jgi:hypothetical protein